MGKLVATSLSILSAGRTFHIFSVLFYSVIIFLSNPVSCVIRPKIGN